MNNSANSLCIGNCKGVAKSKMSMWKIGLNKSVSGNRQNLWASEKIACCLCFCGIFQNSFADQKNQAEAKTKVNELFFHQYNGFLKIQRYFIYVGQARKSGFFGIGCR